MKIRSVLDKKVGEAEYRKYLVTLPKEIVERSNLLQKELRIRLHEGQIIIEQDS